MCNWRLSAVLLWSLMPTIGWAVDPIALSGLGRPATQSEIAAWDIDVRPDFLGLPPGRGSVLQGEDIWLVKCASCHGDFGESNEVFSPIASGNITSSDIDAGRVNSVLVPGYARTPLMRLSTI